MVHQCVNRMPTAVCGKQTYCVASVCKLGYELLLLVTLCLQTEATQFNHVTGKVKAFLANISP